MKITPKYADKTIQLPARCAEFLSEASREALCVLVSVMNEPVFEPEELSAKLSMSTDRLMLALDFWRDAGILTFRSPKEKAPVYALEVTDGGTKKAVMSKSALPRYSSAQVSDYIEGNKKIARLLNCCQQTLGKMFNTAEVEIIVGLLDYLSLSPDYIMLLCAHSAKWGKTSLRYIEKMAIGLFDDGILTYAELEAHLKNVELANEAEAPLRELFGIGKRALTKKEKETFTRWMGEWGLALDMIAKAYEATVDTIGKVSLPYTNAILEKWYKSGCRSAADVSALADTYNGTKNKKKGSFDTDDFFEAALKRSYQEN